MFQDSVANGMFQNLAANGRFQSLVANWNVPRLGGQWKARKKDLLISSHFPLNNFTETFNFSF
jgi:hypothetical protein